nr:hypothetical protein [Angustibacter aerolatus]
MPDLVTTTWWRKDRDPRKALRRLQPERPRPHHRQRLLGARHPARRRLDPHPLGRGRRRRAPRPHHRHRARPLRRGSVSLHAAIDDVAHSIEPLLEWADRDGVEVPDADEPSA